MAPRTRMLWIAMVAVLAGCGSGGLSPRDDDRDRLQSQARDALARYGRAVLDAGDRQLFVPVGDLTGQLGDWEPTNEDDKLALLSGQIVAAGALPAAPRRTGDVVWEGGKGRPFPLISADEALNQVAAAAEDCGECVPLQVTGARLTTVRIQTTRGPATAPAWEFKLKGTAVRVTRVAVASSSTVTVTPPSRDPFGPTGGIAVESATTTTSGRQLSVAFTGAPGPGTEPCGADYSAQAVESAHAVAVIVIERRHAAEEDCDALGARRTAAVELTQPLGERAVLEVQQGLPVALTITE
jgi:hypothetical protein